MSRRLIGLVAALLMIGSTALAAEGKGVAGLYSRGSESGVSATARVGFDVSRPSGPTADSGQSGTAAPSSPARVPTPVAISAHNCIPRLDARGVSLSYRFFESSVGDCVSFVSPGPTPARRGPRERTNPRPSPERLAYAAFERVISLAPRPELSIAPGRVGLTGLRSFFWIGSDLAPVTATAGVRGLTVTAEARPVRYRWDFDDGATRHTSQPGRPWTKGRPGNVGHLYETKGRYEPSVTVVWAARWRANGGAWRDLGYFSTAGEAEYPVRQMIAALVRRR